MRPDLIRSEVFESRRVAWLGEVVITVPFRAKFFWIISAVAIVAIILALFVCSYTEKVHIAGALQPSSGLVDVLPSKPGVITAVMVKEGDAVRAGDVLFVVSTELSIPADGAARGTSTANLSTVNKIRRLIEAQAQVSAAVSTKTKEKNSGLLLVATHEVSQIDDEIKLQREQVEMAEEAFITYKRMREQGFISELGLSKSKSEFLMQQSKLVSLNREKTRLLKDLEQTRHVASIESLKEASDQLAIERDAVAIQKEELGLRSEREFAVVAPCDGRISAITAHIGQQAASRPVAAIIPDGSHIQGVASVRNDIAPFISRGQRVDLKFVAFPYQKYGQLDGEILTVSESDTAATTGSSASESVRNYIVRIELSAKSTAEINRLASHKNGLSFEAAVHVAKRPIYQILIPQSSQLRSK